MADILLIEDELEVADSLKGYLELKGYSVATADDGERGLALMVQEKPRLVLLDMKLGSGISGMEVLRRAKEAKEQAQIIVVTAVDDQNVVDMAKGLGADGYLTKPMDLKDLEQAVLTRLERP